MSLKVSFYGGAGKVTGSHFLVEGTRGRTLVDCGIEQGHDAVESHMYDPFPYDVSLMGSLVVTHAHLDHVGRIPRLVRAGFRGTIYMTPPTRDLAELILRDSVSLLAEEAARHGKDPLYEERDVDTTFSLVELIEYHTEKEVSPGLFVYLRNTGHILGSASVRIKDESGVSVALTGDIGNSPSPLLPDWEAVTDADAIIMESVYGDRVHPPEEERVGQLRDVLKKAIQKGGTILIPAFSLERTQLMLYELSNMYSANELPHVPVFLDSPLAIKVTDVYERWGSAYFKKETKDEMRREGSIFDFPFLKKTLSREQSMEIGEVPGPKIIIAGAGMSHGGRIGRWETRYLPDPKTTLIMVGYQAPGTPGRRMLEGARSVSINGATVRIRATVLSLSGWSAHADRDELVQFAGASVSQEGKGKRPVAVFTAIGEPSAERFLAQRIHDYVGLQAIVPEIGETWEIEPKSVKKLPI